MSRFKIWERGEVYRIYVTDSLYALCEGAKNGAKRYLDLVEDVTPFIENPEELAESIIDSIRGKLG